MSQGKLKNRNFTLAKNHNILPIFCVDEMFRFPPCIFQNVPSAGVEPASLVPKTSTLSIELRGRFFTLAHNLIEKKGFLR